MARYAKRPVPLGFVFGEQSNGDILILQNDPGIQLRWKLVTARAFTSRGKAMQWLAMNLLTEKKGES